MQFTISINCRVVYTLHTIVRWDQTTIKIDCLFLTLFLLNCTVVLPSNGFHKCIFQMINTP